MFYFQCMFLMLKPITKTGWLLCFQDILMLWEGIITFTSLPLFHCDENMQPPETKTKTYRLGHNKFSVSVWDVNNITWWRKLKIVRDWWAYLNCSNHVCLKWKLASTLLAVLTSYNFFPIFNADCCFCLHLGYAEDSTAQNALTYSSQKFQPFNTQE